MAVDCKRWNVAVRVPGHLWQVVLRTYDFDWAMRGFWAVVLLHRLKGSGACVEVMTECMGMAWEWWPHGREGCGPFEMEAS